MRKLVPPLQSLLWELLYRAVLAYTAVAAVFYLAVVLFVLMAIVVTIVAMPVLGLYQVGVWFHWLPAL